MFLHHEDGSKISYKEEWPFKIDKGIILDNCNHRAVGIPLPELKICGF